MGVAGVKIVVEGHDGEEEDDIDGVAVVIE